MLYMVIDVLSSGIFAVLFVWAFLALWGERSLRRMALTGLFTLYLCVMFDVVGIPGFREFRWEPCVNLIPFSDEKTLRFYYLVGMNALMFLPFGFLLPVLWRNCRRWWVTTLAGLLTSGMIEFLQLFSFRATDVDDLLMNTLGASLGYFLAWLLFRRSWLRPPKPDSCRANPWASLTAVILIPLLVAICLAPSLRQVIYSLPVFS